jgi:hypothetical protein
MHLSILGPTTPHGHRWGKVGICYCHGYQYPTPADDIILWQIPHLPHPMSLGIRHLHDLFTCNINFFYTGSDHMRSSTIIYTSSIPESNQNGLSSHFCQRHVCVVSTVKCPTPRVKVHMQIENNPHLGPVWGVVGPNIDRCKQLCS